jgi:hypothetical protein
MGLGALAILWVNTLLIAASTVSRAIERHRAVALGAGFALLLCGVSLGCSVVALHAPRFGTVSTVGGWLGIVWFLVMQPASLWFERWLGEAPDRDAPATVPSPPTVDR